MDMCRIVGHTSGNGSHMKCSVIGIEVKNADPFSGTCIGRGFFSTGEGSGEYERQRIVGTAAT